jgi:hypothetical protein
MVSLYGDLRFLLAWIPACAGMTVTHRVSRPFTRQVKDAVLLAVPLFPDRLTAESRLNSSLWRMIRLAVPGQHAEARPE